MEKPHLLLVWFQSHTSPIL